MDSRLLIEQLHVSHLADLASALRHVEIYRHIGGVPSIQAFMKDRERALQGPVGATDKERWLNYLVREKASHSMIGRLEATVHDAIAEVAFLFAPEHWGKGYAQEALTWLHAEIRSTCGVCEFWATTVPANTRCRALLERSGYQQVHSGAPALYSYDVGDLVFHLRAMS